MAYYLDLCPVLRALRFQLVTLVGLGLPQHDKIFVIPLFPSDRICRSNRVQVSIKAIIRARYEISVGFMLR